MIKTGGSAFPQANHDAYGMGPGHIDDTAYYDISGMSLRDYFAAKALQGQLAFSPHDSFDKYNQPDEVAEMSYRFADAMLEARKK